MKFLVSALVALSSVSLASARCCVPETSITKLDFYDSEVRHNLLHVPGGNLTYEGIGLFENKRLDLVITADDDYSDIKAVWDSLGKGIINGKNGKFGKINLQTVQGKPDSGKGIFKFCLYDEDQELVTLPTHTFSIFDADFRAEGQPIEEKLTVDFEDPLNAGIQKFQLGDAPNSEITVSCESGGVENDLGICVGGATEFNSGTWGTGADNPSDPDDLTPQQNRRSIMFYMEETSCWTMTYNHYCPYEQNGGTGECSWYGGGNFLFAGHSATISETEGCTPVHPTPAPTELPDPAPPRTDSPTTANPTKYPTASPTTANPTKYPTASPTTANPTKYPTASPTTANPTKAPTPDCPADIELVGKVGVTDIDIGGSIEIVSRDGEKVTVKLTNTWGDDLDMYYQYKPDYLNEKCFAEADVPAAPADGSTYAEITMQCFHSEAFTVLEICVTDDCTIHLKTEDNAIVPQCCETTTYEQAVCYKLVVWCEDQCPTTQRERALQALRGHA